MKATVLFCASIFALSLPASAQLGGPITRIEIGSGFGCAPPKQWVMSGGVATCSLPVPRAPAEPARVEPTDGPLGAQPLQLAWTSRTRFGSFNRMIELKANATGITATYMLPALNNPVIATCSVSAGRACDFSQSGNNGDAEAIFNQGYSPTGDYHFVKLAVRPDHSVEAWALHGFMIVGSRGVEYGSDWYHSVFTPAQVRAASLTGTVLPLQHQPTPAPAPTGGSDGSDGG